MRTRDQDKVKMVKAKAMEMAVAEGFEGFSVNKLAKACGISVATLYIYYKDKDDLLQQIALEEGKRMTDMTMKGFDPAMPFAEGLKVQWRNRAKYMLENPTEMLFCELVRSSTYQEQYMTLVMSSFKEVMGKFMKNCVQRGEINKMPVEVFWSVAYAPLYAMLRFHNEGTSVGGRKFVITDRYIWQAFDLVVKALTP